MTQHAYTIANAQGATFRGDIQAAFQAAASNNVGASAPATTYAGMWWPDTTSGWVKQRNSANSAWIKRFPLGTGAAVDVASASTVDLDANAVTSAVARITGTTTTTAITLTDGQTRLLRAAAAWPITHGASLICPGAASYTCAAGDLILAIGEASGVVRLMIWKADGTPVVAPSSSGIQGMFRNLAGSAPGNSAVVTYTADEVVTGDNAGNFQTTRGWNSTITMTTSGAGGLDAGSVAANTWYYAYAITKPDGTKALLASTSSSSPTLPSGYTKWARLGAFRTDGTGNKYPLGFKTFGRRSQLTIGAGNVANLPIMASGTLGTYPGTYAAIAVGNYVPPTASRILVAVVAAVNAAAAVAPNNSYGSVNSLTNPPFLNFQSYPSGVAEMLLESTNIYAVSSASITVVCAGWEDNL